MCIDRQAVDREVLIDWVRDFLWHFEGACVGGGPEKWPENPANIIVTTILDAMNQDESDAEDGQNRRLNHLPNPASFFQNG